MSANGNRSYIQSNPRLVLYALATFQMPMRLAVAMVAELSCVNFAELQSLVDLPQGMPAIVDHVASRHSEATQGSARRLAEIGFLPGERVLVLRRVAGGEPLAVRIGSSTFALRKHEAQCIFVRPEL